MTKLIIKFMFTSTTSIFKFLSAEDQPEERRKILEEYKEDYYNTIKLYNHYND